MAVEISRLVARSTKALGTPLVQFRTSALHTGCYLALGVIAISLGLGTLAFLIHAFAEAPDEASQPFRTVALGILFVSAGVGLLIKAHSLRGSGVIAFDKGLARVRGGVCDVLRWDEIEVVERGTPPGNEQFTITKPVRLCLRSAKLGEWVFSESLGGIKDFRDLVEERTLPHLVAGARAALTAGRTLSFGDIGLKREGLTFPARPLLDWDLVADAGLGKGTVVVSSKVMSEAYFQVPLHQAPNAHLLLALIELFRSGKA